MPDTIDLHLKDVPYTMRYQAFDAGEHFAKQHPGRVGVRHGVAYRAPNAVDGLYVYRTRTGRIVVRYSPATKI